MGEIRPVLGLLLLLVGCGNGEGGRGKGSYDVLLRGGWIVDGSGNPRHRGDVAIAGNRIARLGFLPGAEARETLDVPGLVVAPGFIDMMGQSEINVLIDNRVLSKVTQGVTTEVTGEGGSVAPLTNQLVRDDSDAMKKWHYREDWRDLDGYIAQLERHGSTVNIATFVGATQVRLAVIGNANRQPTAPALDASIPTWAESGGWDSLLVRLRDPKTRARLHDEMAHPAGGAESFFYEAGGGAGVLITGTFQDSLRYLQGKRISEIAAARHRDPVETVFDIVLAEGGHRTDAVYFVMSEPDVQAALQTWWVAVNTDFGGVAPDGPLGTQSAHPRAYGTFARILGHYVRELKLFPLEFAVRKMTSLAAQRVGLKDRGLLAPGMAADLTIFDPNTVADRATFERPHQPSVGFAYVFVNGQKVLDHGALTAARPGRGLRGPGYVPPERRGR